MAAQEKVPVTILTGFLGSGKTTLLNHILNDQSHGMKFAVIENEFGAVGIDNELVSLKQDTSDEIIEMTNGCICCNVRGDLIPVVKKMLTRKDNFDAILIETTGLADPAPVIQTFFIDEEIASQCSLDGVITVVDAKHIVMHLEEEKPEDARNESVEQLAFADRILLNKTDLVDANELKDVTKAIRAVNSDADIIESQYSRVDPKKLIGIQCFNLDRVLEMEPEFLSPNDDDDDDDHVCDDECDHEHGHHDHKHNHGHDNHEHSHEEHSDDNHERSQDSQGDDGKPKSKIPVKQTHRHGRKHVHDNRVGSISFKFDGDIVVSQLQKLIKVLIREKGKDLYRYKGVLSVAGKDEKFVFQGVHMVFDSKFMGHWQEGEKRQSKFVFIGKDMNKENIAGAFEACKAKELRFKVGDNVQANFGKFVNGTVVALWDDGNPYRVRLENDKEVWAPQDNDRYIRLPRT